MRRPPCWMLAATLVFATTNASAAQGAYEKLRKKSVRVYNMRSVLLPFITTCERKRTRFRRLFCEALNERLKSQHQSRIYRQTFEPSALGPLVVTYVEKPKPHALVKIRGCLTCRGPMLQRRGGDISKARFFLFKLPKTIKIRRGRRRQHGSKYDLGDISVVEKTVNLPEKMTKKKFEAQYLPHIKLDMMYRPVAGVTRVGRYKYGVLNFELAGYRIYHKCAGKVLLSSPQGAKRFKVSKNDLSCPQNQPKGKIARPKVPTRLPQALVKRLMKAVAEDMQTCYSQFGKRGEAPADIVVSPTGKVKAAKVVGKLANTASARCVERLVKNVKFPRFRGQDVRLQWPFTLAP